MLTARDCRCPDEAERCIHRADEIVQLLAPSPTYPHGGVRYIMGQSQHVFAIDMEAANRAVFEAAVRSLIGGEE